MGIVIQRTAANCSGTTTTVRVGFFSPCWIEGTVSDDPTVADGQLRRAAIEYMSEHRARVPLVAAARIGRTFNVFRPFQQVHLESERGTSTWVLRAALFAYWALVPIAVIGAVAARRRQIPIWPLLAFPVAVLVSVAFTIGAVRYRALAEIPLVLLAAFAIAVVTKRAAAAHAARARQSITASGQ